MICICTLLPLLIASVKKTIVYNGWRHFYFSYLGIIVLAAYGLELLMERFGRVIPILATTLICLTAIQMGFNHPYQYAYFNVLTEREDRQLYDTDYWGVSTRDALDYILDHDNSNEMVQISWGTDSTRLLLINAYNVMPYERGMKIDLVYDYDDAEYIVVNTTSGVVNGFEKPDGFYLFALRIVGHHVLFPAVGVQGYEPVGGTYDGFCAAVIGRKVFGFEPFIFYDVHYIVYVAATESIDALVKVAYGNYILAM